MVHKGSIRIKRLKRSLREIWVSRMKRRTRVMTREIRNLFNKNPLLD
jgi:hypothetical protein